MKVMRKWRHSKMIYTCLFLLGFIDELAGMIPPPGKNTNMIRDTIEISSSSENTGSVTSDSLSDVQKKAILQLHNAFRSMVKPAATNMLKMEWDDDLKKIAQDFANKCIVAHNPDRHRLAKNYDWVGENIAWGTGTCGDKECGDIYEGVKRWFSESKAYDYVSGQCSGKCTLYTQMVWWESNKLGCGAKRCGDRTILVCNYAPGGNYVGQRPYRTGNTSCSECPSGLVCDDNLCSKLDMEASCKNGICRLRLEKPFKDMSANTMRETSDDKINTAIVTTAVPPTRTMFNEAQQRQLLGPHMLPEGWVEYPIHLTQVDSGITTLIWGMNGKHTLFSIEQDMSLTPVDGTMHHVSAGQDGVWAVGLLGNIFFRRGVTAANPRGMSWEKIPGNLKQIDAGKHGIVWGVNRFDRIFCRIGIQQPDHPFGIGWMRVEGNLKYVSCGEYGCWGVNKRDNVYFRLGITPSRPQGTQWIIVPGKLRMIESGPAGMTVGVSDENDVFVRTDVSLQKPEGSRWVKLDLKFAHVTVGMRGIVGILPDGTVAIHSRMQGFARSNPTIAPTEIVPTPFCHTCPCPCICPCLPEMCCSNPTVPSAQYTTPVRTAPPIIQASMPDPNALAKSLAALSQLSPAGSNVRPGDAVANQEKLHLTPELANRILKLIEQKGNAFEEDHKAAAATGSSDVAPAGSSKLILPVRNQQGSRKGDNAAPSLPESGLNRLVLTPALPAVVRHDSQDSAANPEEDGTKATSDAVKGGDVEQEKNMNPKQAAGSSQDKQVLLLKDTGVLRKLATPAARTPLQTDSETSTAKTTATALSTSAPQVQGNPLARTQDAAPAAAPPPTSQSGNQATAREHLQVTQYPPLALPTTENHTHKQLIRTPTHRPTASIHHHARGQRTRPYETSLSHPTRRTPTRTTSWHSEPTLAPALVYPNPMLPRKPYSPYAHAHHPPASLNNLPLVVPATTRPRATVKTHPTPFSGKVSPPYGGLPARAYPGWQRTLPPTHSTPLTTRSHLTIAAPNPESKVDSQAMIGLKYPTQLPPTATPGTKTVMVPWQLTSSCCAIPDSVCPISRDCLGYIECRGYRGSYKTCQGGKLFNPATNICDYPRNFDCDGSKGQEPRQNFIQPEVSSRHEASMASTLSAGQDLASSVPLQSMPVATPQEALPVSPPELSSLKVAPASFAQFPAREIPAPLPVAPAIQPAAAIATMHVQAPFQTASHDLHGQAYFANKAKPRVETPRADDSGVLREVWFGLGLSPLLTNLTNNPRFPASPDEYIVLDKFEAPPNAGDGYGQRLSTYYRAPQTGEYTFYISCDNECELWVSPDTEEIHSNLILELKHGHFTSFRQWHKYPEEQTSRPVYLQEGEFYFIESFMKEGTGGDDLSVGIKLPNGVLELPIVANLFLVPRVRDGNTNFAKPITTSKAVPDLQQAPSFYGYPPQYSAYATGQASHERTSQSSVPGAEMYLAQPDALTFEQSYVREPVKRSAFPPVPSANATLR